MLEISSKQIHMVGIKGVGMTALAQILKSRGKKISGSDTTEKFFTDQVLKKLRIPFKEGFKASNLPRNADLVIYSTAFNPQDHPELTAAKKRKLPLMSYPQALSDLFNRELGVAVSGTHGKTTTSALIAESLKFLGLNPTAVIGSRVASWQTNAIPGRSPFFVIEADEHQNKIALYRPWSLVLTNIDYDHPDFYPNPENYYQAFKKWVGKWQQAKCPLPKIGVFNGNDPKSKRLLKELGLKKSPDLLVLTVGKGKGNNIRLRANYEFDISGPGQKNISVKIKTKLLGAHNQYNLASALAFVVGLNTIASSLGLSPIPMSKIASSFRSFSGTERRMQLVGRRGKVAVYDDYAHHPAEIKAALSSIKGSFPRHELFVIFQPHTFTRTRTFLKEFASALKIADMIGLLPVYGSARENQGETTSLDIAQLINKKSCQNFASPKECLDFLSKYPFAKPTILVTMGAGDGWQVGRKFLKIKT
jgi:UDP-N-acetylmuramate--alanine ligase